MNLKKKTVHTLAIDSSNNDDKIKSRSLASVGSKYPALKITNPEGTVKKQLQNSYHNIQVEDEYWRDPARVTIIEYQSPVSYFFEGKEFDVSAEYLVGYTKHLERKLNNPRFMNNAREEVIDKVRKELEFVKNIK